MINQIKPFLFFLIFTFQHLSCASVNIGALKKDVSKVLDSKTLRGADFSVAVRSLKTNQIIFEENGNRSLNPASNVKIITTLAALHFLKPEFRFKTEYYQSGKDLIVKGYGDPSISTERLRAVAHQLKLRGISNILGDLVLDESFFDSEKFAKGYEKERNNQKAWAAPVSALSLNKNSFEVFLRPTANGANAFVSVEPSSSYFQHRGNIKTTKNGFSPVLSTRGTANGMEIVLGGSVGENVGVKSFYRRVLNPTLYFGETLRSLLRTEGVEVTGNIKMAVTGPEAKLLYVDFSPRLTDIIDDANKYSSNFISEMLVKAIGSAIHTPANFSVGLEQIRLFLENKVGLKRGEYVLGNGSGLNQSNQFSANQLTKVLEYAAKNFEIGSEFISSLSVSGTQGTMSKRLKDPFMQRQVRAKTGTLTGVSSLSGYLAGEKDELLAFSMIFANHHSSARSVTQIQDAISKKIAREFRVVEQSNLDSELDPSYESDGAAEDEETQQGGG